MKRTVLQPKQAGLFVMTIALGASCLITPSAQAQSGNQTPAAILQQQGSLQPSQDEYSFTGKKGQAVTIALTSDAFDTFLTLLDPDGEEIASNDDYGRSLNSAIVITLPQDGTYKVLTKSYSGQGGDYSITVRPATPYEQAYSQGVNEYQEGNLRQAIAAMSEAIELDPNQPIAYLDRGDLYYEQDNLEAMIQDYQKAAELYEQQGDQATAQTLRQQISEIRSTPEAERPEIPAQLTPQIFRR